MTQRDRFPCRFLGVSLLLALASAATAGIVDYGGSVVIAEPPPDIQLDQWESDTEARLWQERHTVLAADLSVDALNTGTFKDGTENIPGVVPALTSVTSYMLRSDPVTSHKVYQGFIVFDEPIIGASFYRFTLNSTDAAVGRPGVSYNTNAYRGLELPSGDSEYLTISSDRRRVDFSLSTGGWTDDFRIITQVPTPGSIAFPMLGVFGCAGRSRRRR